MTNRQAALLGQFTEACKAVGVPWRLIGDPPGSPLQLAVPADRFGLVRPLIAGRVDVLWSGGIGRALLFYPDAPFGLAARVALLDDSAFSGPLAVS